MSVRKLVSRASRCWHAEYVAVARYMRSEHRTDETDTQWVRFQAHKEWTGSGVYGEPGVNVRAIVSKAAEKVASSDLDTPLEQMESISNFLSFGADEFRHYVQLYKTYTLLCPNTRMDLDQAGSLKEGTELTTLRHRTRTSRLGEMAVDLSEGGGLAMYFALRDFFGEFPATCPSQHAMRTVGEVTLADELGHFRARLRRVLNSNLSDKECETVAENLFAVCRVKAHERNAQFGYPLTAEQVESLCSNEAGGRQFLDHHLKDQLNGV